MKAPRYITQIRRLRDVDTPIANFFASGVFRLQHKLGPILWQCPPNFSFDPATYSDAMLDTWAERIRAWRRGGSRATRKGSRRSCHHPARRATCSAISTAPPRNTRRATQRDCKRCSLRQPA